MAAADKARYFLERSVPELQQLAKKNIFSSDEITAIVKKRNDFEHILNGPGHKPSDYVRYAAYEMNLSTLQKKRCQRLGVKHTSHYGSRAVFFILERATNKFPGDKSLWLQYIQYCQKEKAHKKLARAFTSVLRLRPRDEALWIVAAKHYAESQGDMPTARGYLQRGIRFCSDERQLYLQYAKLEMVYLAKLSARRQLLGLDKSRVEESPREDDDNEIVLPTVTAQDFEPADTQGLEHVNEDMLKRLANAPLLQGAVPIAIFDGAMKQFHQSAELAEDFFDLTMAFSNIKAIEHVQQHILQHLETISPQSAELVMCRVKQMLSGIAPDSVEFPSAFSKSLSIVRDCSLDGTEDKRRSKKVVQMLRPYLDYDLDEAVRRVLTSVIDTHDRRQATT